jgi:glucokinase
LILDGELWHGAYGSAGEFGHMTVDFEGPLCDCGNRGCIEAIAAGPDIAAWVGQQIAAGRASALSCQSDLSGRDVVEAAQLGDALAVSALDRAGRAVGFGVINVAHLVNLDVVVVGGGIANAGDLLFDPLRTTVREHLLASTAPNLRIEPWSLGEDVGLLGAAAAARSRLLGDV